MAKVTSEQYLGSYDCVIGYNENVLRVQEILEQSGRLPDGNIITEAIARLVWASVSKRMSFEKTTVTELDLDLAIESLNSYTSQYLN